MAYLIFTDKSEAEAYQATVDAELGYPEDPDSLTWVGGGIHCPKELGLAVHYSEPIVNDKADSWAMPEQDEATAVCIGPLPSYEKTEVAIVAKPTRATKIAELTADFVKAETITEAPIEEVITP